MRTLTRPQQRGTRNEKLVTLRSAMPVQLMTLHHDIPRFGSVDLDLSALTESPADGDDENTATPKVHGATVDTAARKGAAR
jgi:hypothetical protein